MLEASCYEHNLFSTFTYEVPPYVNDTPTLVKAHITSTFHRLRARLRESSRSVRFYACGEYGGQTQRPHYHAVVFGLGLRDVQLLEGAWHGLRDPAAEAGFSSHGLLTLGGAEYVTGYVTKKLSELDHRSTCPRLPEFAVMSRVPGLGAPGLLAVIEALNTSAGALYMARYHDVPVAFQIGGRMLPLGPYCRQRLRLFFFGSHLEPEEAAALRERSSLEKVLPPMLLAETPFVRRQLVSQNPEAFRQAVASYHATAKQKALIQAKRHTINTQRKTL